MTQKNRKTGIAKTVLYHALYHGLERDADRIVWRSQYEEGSDYSNLLQLLMGLNQVGTFGKRAPG